MKVHVIDQRSDGWHQLRLGRPTASRFDQIITPQGKPSAQARKYKYLLTAERVLGHTFKKDLSGIQHVMDGIRLEPAAVLAFTDRTGLGTAPIGFVSSDDGQIGCSPDRVITGKHQGVEIKCPTAPVHIGYLLEGVEEAYRAQIQGQILICGFELVHFFSYHPELAPHHTIMQPDPVFIEKLDALLTVFCAELDEAEQIVRRLGVYPKNMESAFPEEEEPAF